MVSGFHSLDDGQNDGLPDEAFTESELAAGVQHIFRTGNPNAISPSGSPLPSSLEPTEYDDGALLSHSPPTLRFETYSKAKAWAQANPGGVITRASDGHGFETKSARQEHGFNSARCEVESYSDRSIEIKAMVPHLHDVLSNSGSNSRRMFMRPFCRSTWQLELSRLSTVQLKRLQLLVTIQLEHSRRRLRLIDAEMRRFPSMVVGDYGEAASEQLNDIKEKALADIDARLSEGRDI